MYCMQYWGKLLNLERAWNILWYIMYVLAWNKPAILTRNCKKAFINQFIVIYVEFYEYIPAQYNLESTLVCYGYAMAMLIA